MSNGGSAFPSPGVLLDSGRQQGAYEGMTLRDYFAAVALGPLLEFSLLPQVRNTPPNAETAAMAYAIADAMLKERAR